MPEKVKVPAIRFKGFTDAWEQRKLGEVGSTYTGLSGKSKVDFGHGEGRYVTYMNVFTSAISSSKMVEPIEIDTKQNEVKAGDVFFTTSSETPEEVGMSSVMLENWPNTYLNSFCFGYRPIEIFDNYYLAYMLRSDSVRENIVFLAQGISRYNISKNRVMEIEVPIPQMAEQRLLGDYFRNLDNLITLHQRKYEKLQNLKKACLEKMFPKNGSNVPEIRFTGFTDAWEQRKLCELEVTGQLTLCRGDVISGKDMKVMPGNYPVYSSSAHNNGCMGEYGKWMFDQELITWSIDGGGAVFYRPKHRFSVTNVCGYLVINKGLNYAFLGYQMGYIHSGIPFDYTVKAHPSVIKDLYRVGIPTIDEQRQIGLFFSNLDNLITLHQRKYEKLQNLKKACLEKMFV